jgi:hypothetical protein
MAYTVFISTNCMGNHKQQFVILWCSTYILAPTHSTNFDTLHRDTSPLEKKMAEITQMPATKHKIANNVKYLYLIYNYVHF